MRRILASLGVFAVLAAVLLIPALFYDSGGEMESVYEPTTITKYEADFTVDADGGMDAVETLTVDFPVSDRHGIFRFFDRVDASEPDVRHVVEDVEVTMDGDDVPVDQYVEDGRYDVLKIGDPDSTLSVGEHVFEIRYHLPSVLTPGDPGEVDTDSQFYWNLIPSGWQQTIEQSQLTVHLPEPADDVQCAVGIGTAEEECDVKGVGTDTLTVRTGGLDDHTPVTLLAGQAVPTPELVTLPWAPRFDLVFGDSVPVLLTVVVIALLMAGLGFWLAQMSVEREPRFPLQYGPPDGIGPGQAHYVLKESIGREQFVATLMYAADKDAIGLDRQGDAWVITDKRGPEGWAEVDEVTRETAGLLSGPGSTFVASPKDVSAGKHIQQELSDFQSAAKAWARGEGLVTKAGVGGLGGLLVLIGVGGVIATVIWNPFDMSMAGLPLAAFAAAAIPLLRTGAATKRTHAGRELWSRIGGFYRVLSTPASQERFDFSGRKELYTAYIPWAVAFGCADQWAEKFRVETGEEPPTPRYFGAYGVGYGAAVSSMVNDFDSTLNSAISSYQATQRSSSSGGGGFSGGGGGGGGGGGSW